MNLPQAAGKSEDPGCSLLQPARDQVHANYCRSKNFRPPIAKNSWLIFLHFNQFAYDLPLIFQNGKPEIFLRNQNPLLGMDTSSFQNELLHCHDHSQRFLSLLNNENSISVGFDDTISTENRNYTQFEEQQTLSQDQRTQSSYKEKNMLSVGAHYCNSNTWEAEAGVQSWPSPQS